MEFDPIDFNDLEVLKEYLLVIEQDNLFIIGQCLQLNKVGEDIYNTFFSGDIYRDDVIIYSGGLRITPHEGIKIYNWPPQIDGTGGMNTVNSAGGGTGNSSRKRKNCRRKSRKNRS